MLNPSNQNCHVQQRLLGVLSAGALQMRPDRKFLEASNAVTLLAEMVG